MRGNSLLVAADEIHSHKPLDEAYLSILENGSHKGGKTLVALLADIPTITAV